MKIKFFSLLLLLTVSSFGWANSTTLPLAEPLAEGDVSVTISLTVEVDLANEEDATMAHVFDHLDKLEGDNLTCEVTIKVKVGTSGTGMEGSITVKGDCETIVAEAKKQLAALKELVSRR